MGAIRLGAVHDAHMVQRHFAGLEREVHGFVALDFDGDFLPAGQQVVFRERVLVR